MIVEEILVLVARHWFVVTLVAGAAFLLNNKFYKGLNQYPGPWLAGYTNWWRYFDVLGRAPQITHIALHEKYGDTVRLGPNVLSVSKPEVIKVIYGLKKGMTKSDFYPIQQAVAQGKRLQSLFTTKDEAYHTRYRRCINNAFVMSSLVEYEPLVDSTTRVFIQKTREYFIDKNQVCDFSKWLHYYAFDVIGELTWSKRLGYVEENEDVGGVIKFVSDFLSYAGPVGQMPFLDLLWKKNPFLLKLEQWGLIKKEFLVTKFALSRAAERRDEMAKIRETGIVEAQPGKGIDLLSKFHLAQHDHPDFMTDFQVLASCTSMIFAGSETTAISLSSVFYFLLHNRAAYSQLMAELDDAVTTGKIEERDDRSVTWTEAQTLPYLDAVIQEAFRLHPAVGLILERVTPPEGITIGDQHFPGGIIVGCNPWVLHRRTDVFGADVHAFRPQRWLDADAAQLKEMKACMFQFGAGSRTCLGKNISLLEMYKLVPTFLRNFEIEMACDHWKLVNQWFVKQEDFWCRFRVRA